MALRESLDSGVAGVIGSVAVLLTGAAGAGGFKGLGGRHSRRNLLQFGVSGNGNGIVAGFRDGRIWLKFDNGLSALFSPEEVEPAVEQIVMFGDKL